MIDNSVARILLMDCARCIEDAIGAGMSQKDIAQDYAMAMYSEVYGGWEADWPRVNKAIAARWPKGLARVKEMAHRKYREMYKEPYSPCTTSAPDEATLKLGSIGAYAEKAGRSHYVTERPASAPDEAAIRAELVAALRALLANLYSVSSDVLEDWTMDGDERAKIALRCFAAIALAEATPGAST